MHKKFVFVTLLFTLIVVFSLPVSVFAKQTYDMSDPSNYNIRIDGIPGLEYWPVTANMSDYDHDGYKDLLAAPQRNADMTPSAVLITNSLLNQLSPGIHSLPYTAKYHSLTSSTYVPLGLSTSKLESGLCDINNNGIPDLVLQDMFYYTDGADFVGKIYIVLDDLLSGQLSSESNDIDLTQPSNFSFALEGVSERQYMRPVSCSDINNDGKHDLSFVVSHYNVSDSENFSHILDNSTLLDIYNQVGSSEDRTFEYTLEYVPDLEIHNQYKNNNTLYSGFDYDGDGTKDLIITSLTTSGSPYESAVYFVSGDIVNRLWGTVTSLDLGVSTNYDFKFVGSGTALLSFIPIVDDFNQDGISDILFIDINADIETADDGALYFINGEKIRELSEGGKSYTLQDHYSQLIYGPNFGIYGGLGRNLMTMGSYGSAWFVDINYDGYTDVLATKYESDYTGDHSGSVYLLDGKEVVTPALAASGSSVMVENTDYLVRYDGGYAGDKFGLAVFYEDINRDGRQDLLMSNDEADFGGANTGALYIIYNFPHTVTATTSRDSIINDEETTTVTGSITVSEYSVTSLSKVEWNTSNSPASTGWTECTIDDGVIDELTEEFTCIVPRLDDGKYNIYVRAMDENGFYTRSQDYASLGEFSVDRKASNSSSFIVGEDLGKEEHKKPSFSLIRTNKLGIRLFLSPGDSVTPNAFYMVSRHHDFDDTSWKPYDDDISFTLADEEGDQHIYLKFKDAAGNVSDTFVKKMELDRIPPEGFELKKIGALDYSMGYDIYYYTATKVTFSGVSEDKSKIKLYINDVLYEDEPRIPSGQANWEISNVSFEPGTYKIKIFAKDNADNSTEPLEFTLVIDPTMSSFPDFLIQ